MGMTIREIDLHLDISDDFISWIRDLSGHTIVDPYTHKTLVDYDQERILKILNNIKENQFNEILKSYFKGGRYPKDLQTRDEIIKGYFLKLTQKNENWRKLEELESFLELALSEGYFIFHRGD
jgi:hypothetical protein